MIDATLIVRKINLISQDFKEIGELSRKSLQEFLASRVDEVLAERYLERMIGRMIDINYHLIDPTRIHEALQTAARDVPQYLTHVHSYIERLSR